MRDLEASIWEQRNAQNALPGVVKTASDIARYERLLAEVQPAWVVECGAFTSAAACWFADTARCSVVTIDNHPQTSPEYANHPDVTLLIGNSVDPGIVTLVTSLVGADAPVVVVLDSDHSADHVYAEMVSYAPLVNVGSYMIAEDTIVAWLPEQKLHYRDSSPLEAVEKFLAEHPDEWVVDTALEDLYPTTQNPSGFLRKLR